MGLQSEIMTFFTRVRFAIAAWRHAIDALVVLSILNGQSFVDSADRISS